MAKDSEVVIFVGGLDNTVEGEGYFIKGDRLTGSVDLPGVQNELINELAAANPNMVLIVISGGPCAVNKVINNVKGLLYACYPGQEGGRALADSSARPGKSVRQTARHRPEKRRPVAGVRHRLSRTSSPKGSGYRWFDSQKISARVRLWLRSQLYDL